MSQKARKLVILHPEHGLITCAFTVVYNNHIDCMYSLIISVYGKDVKAVVEQPLEEELMHPGKNTVTYESRLLKSLMLDLI